MGKLNRIFCFLLCLVLLCGSIPQANANDKEIVLRIISQDGFLRFAENCRLDSYSKDLTVLLCSNIDLTGTNFAGIPSFSGTFDGNGYTITLDMEPKGSSIGLFRYLDESATVKNLHVSGRITPIGSANAVGGIVGTNGGVVENCAFNGTVSGKDSIGGLVGVNQLTGIVTGSLAEGTVNGNHFIGGIAGDNYGVIRNCENHAKVNTTIEENSVALEDITLDSMINSESASTVTDIGGICGTGTGVVRDCVNYGSIGYPQIGYNIGGIAGSFSGYIFNCINRGEIDGRKEVGGIIGQLEPAVNMIYEEDTIQTLQQQMHDLSNTAGGIGANIQSGSNALNAQTQRVEEQLKDAQEALEILMPEDPENPTLPDEETLQAARNALSSSLSNLTGSLSSMTQISQNTFGAVYGNLQSISGQMNAISDTIGTASENLGGGIQDISDEDTADNLTAKIRSCINIGSVTGDWNIGGIAGAMTIENDLDPESDLQIIGNSSLNFDMQLRAVILDCTNNGNVIGKKQNIGGIVGWASMGLVKQCMNTAAVDAATADYTGGIAGQSSGFIRACNAKCDLSGDTYVGGIAGTGTTVTDCNSIVVLDANEKIGAILGSMDEAEMSSNYYLILDTDPGAVDGISYDTQAQPLESSRFFALEDLPGRFRQVSVTFVYEDSSRKLSLPYGAILSPELFPEVPQIANCESEWQGPILPGDPVYHDVVFRLESTEHLYTLESDLRSDTGLPQFLVQGEFPENSSLSAQLLYGAGYPAWEVSMPESMTDRKLRCLIPQALSGEELQVLVQKDGAWQEVAYTTDGSYLVFSAEPNINAVALAPIPTDYMPYYIGGGAILLLIVAATSILIIKRKKKS